MFGYEWLTPDFLINFGLSIIGIILLVMLNWHVYIFNKRRNFLYIYERIKNNFYSRIRNSLLISAYGGDTIKLRNEDDIRNSLFFKEIYDLNYTMGLLKYNSRLYYVYLGEFKNGNEDVPISKEDRSILKLALSVSNPDILSLIFSMADNYHEKKLKIIWNKQKSNEVLRFLECEYQNSIKKNAKSFIKFMSKSLKKKNISIFEIINNIYQKSQDKDRKEEDIIFGKSWIIQTKIPTERMVKFM